MFPIYRYFFKFGGAENRNYTDGKEVVVKADAPGVKKEDMQVALTDDTITFRGEEKSIAETKKENFFHSERFYGCYSNTLPLHVLAD